jgi:hypothetical protein
MKQTTFPSNKRQRDLSECFLYTNNVTKGVTNEESYCSSLIMDTGTMKSECMGTPFKVGQI